ncbi:MULTISPECIES: hypothetical protein [Klebsiella]|uniref:hypothetical protein n=1 Tax=Klebsiella TaxID=570 RepID=UPI0008F966F1|nr:MULTISPECIES: hypothetical protein [Klebsiella]APB44167.1 hypothetical protein AGF18_09655 [Klebsiella oxytoca]MCW9452125.1 hypothetical protein [Klebsiella michiganensis]HAU6242059.1 hypothetical protein [Klebsiella oxytoca]HAU6248081.1 hypothetical protein [Klebsiella oxytoca]HAU6254308.1 hypothetical protein [Klebsiella oxytoca]
MNIETVNELITSLESAGELSIKEWKYLEALKEFRLCSVSLDVAVKVANDFDKVIMECRKITGCPAGVDLQDHMRQLAAENVGLKQSERELDKTCAEEFGPDWVSELTETPATDAYLAGIKADGVLQYAENLDSAADDAERGGYDDAVKCLRSEASAARLFAAQLRKGAAK